MGSFVRGEERGEQDRHHQRRAVMGWGMRLCHHHGSSLVRKSYKRTYLWSCVDEDVVVVGSANGSVDGNVPDREP